MRKGICVAGNMIVDVLYPIEGWPNQGELVQIKDGIVRSTGGAVMNVAVDLAKLDPELPVYAMGRNGEDAEGDLVMQVLTAQPNIDVSNIIREGVSAFTNVMCDLRSKQRTFFTHLGANGRFCEDDIQWDRVNADIFHIAYILLLNALDQPDDEYGSKMARLLHSARAHGMKTSIDVVSEASDRFKRLMPPAMRYADYCTINEFEAEQTTGVKLRAFDGTLIEENIPKALRIMKEMGISTWAVIHSPEGGFGLDEADNFVARRSLKLPDDYIKGTVGAGDAFCAGVLLGAEKGYDLGRAIDLGIAAAAASLSEPGSSEGLRTEAEAMKLFEIYGRR